MTEAKQGTRQSHKAAGKDAADAQHKETADDPTVRRQGRVGQIGDLLDKGVTLLDVGLGLGATLVGRIGDVAQNQIFERFMSQAAAANPSMAAAPPSPAPEMAPTPSPEPETYGIRNRLPLLPGGRVGISFSISNDSIEAPKKVTLSLDGFVGDTHGHRLDIGDFMVKPARKTIAPMDFARFALEGVLLPNIPPDVYRGWVIVGSDTELRIPVWLVVSSA